MLLALFLLNICLLLALIGGFFYVKSALRGAKQGVIDTYVDYFTPETDDKGSKFDQTVDYVAHLFSKRLINTLNAINMQSASVDARMANQLEKDIANDLIHARNPVVGMALDQMPSVKKRLLKNPSAVRYVLPLLQDFLRPPGGPGPGNNGKVETDFIDRLKQQ